MADIEIRRIERHLAIVRVKGTAPLITNRFSEKARQLMLDAQQGNRAPKQSRNPEADFEAAIYRLPDNRHGFPATGFKAAMVGGARYFQNKKLSMTLLKQALFVDGEGSDMLVPLEAGEPKMREDAVRNASGVADLRFRPMYDPWAAELRILYVPSLMSLESVLALVDAGGMGGVGEWRPSSKSSATGVYGTFEVDTSFDVTDINASTGAVAR